MRQPFAIGKRVAKESKTRLFTALCALGTILFFVGSPTVFAGEKICFDNPENYADPYVYYWNVNGAEAPYGWPGRAMTNVGDLHCYDFGSNVPNANVIFNNNGAPQSETLNYTDPLSCYKNHSWMSLDDCGYTPVTVSANHICYDNPNNFQTPTFYHWNVTADTMVNDVDWPGHPMTPKGGYVCYDPGTPITRMDGIFSNNGNNQTGNLEVVSPNNCFDQGVWKTLEQCGFTIEQQGNIAPTAVVPDTITVEEQTSFTLDGSGSNDPDGTIASYLWSDGQTLGAGTFIFNQPGEFNITLTVTDNEGLASAVATTVVTVTARPVLEWPEGKAIYYYNQNSWQQPGAHLWNSVPANSTASTDWPGLPMTAFGTADLWFIDINDATTSGMIIFNDSTQNGDKTGDLPWSEDLLCFKEGNWITLEACGVPDVSGAEAGPDRQVNQNSRIALSSAASSGDTNGATWSSDAWSSSLVGHQVVTPPLANTGTFTVTLTLANGDEDSFTLNVVSVTQGLAERPLLTKALAFPLTGTIDNGNYQYQEAFPNLADMFVSPVMVTNDGVNQNLIYVVDKPGQLYVFPNRADVQRSEVVALLEDDFHESVRDHHEQGLLSVAFHPNFSDNRLVYLYYIEYTGNDPENLIYDQIDPERNSQKFDDGVLARVRLNSAIDPTGIESGSFSTMIKIPSTQADHKGGRMGFYPDPDPDKQYFFMSIGEMGYGDSATASPTVGDGRINNNAQDRTNLQGSFIRVTMLEGDTEDPETGTFYRIPDDNPFRGATDGTREEIWSWGHRNPWRWAFDSVPDASELEENKYVLWEAEIGQDGNNRFEEVNVIRKGKNYGWPICEGSHHRGGLGGDHNNDFDCTSDLEPHVEGYGSTTSASIIGGIVYRGDKLPALNGMFIFGDYNQHNIWGVKKGDDPLSPIGQNNIEKTTIEENFPAFISSFGTDVSGNEIYVSTHGEQFGGPSTIYTIELGDDAQQAVLPATLSETGIFADVIGQIPANGVIEYDVISDGWFDGAKARHFMAIPNDAIITTKENGDWDMPVGSVLIKHLDIPTETNMVPFETSVLFKQLNGNWKAVNYAWNPQGTEAILVTSNSADMDVATFINGATENVSRKHRNGAACANCHAGQGTTPPLDIETSQLNHEFNYQGFDDNQIDVFSAIGLLDFSSGQVDDRFVDPSDETADLHDRALTYLDTNCSGCHFGGAQGSGMDLRFTTPLAARNIMNKSGRLIPFEHTESAIYNRQTTDTLRMPAESTFTNPLAETLFSAWIDAAEIFAEGPTRFSISASETMDIAPGTELTFSSVSVYSNDFESIPKLGVSWASSDTNIVDVQGSSGTITAVAGVQGQVLVEAQYEGNLANVILTVNGGPASPSQFLATAASFSSMSLNWKDNADDELSYMISRSENVNGPFTSIATLPANSTTYVDTGLAEVTRYYYQLKAVNADGDSLVQNADQITPEEPVVESLQIVSGVDVELFNGVARQIVAFSNVSGEKQAATLTATWDSADSDIVTVNAGLITGGSTAGQTTITATIGNQADSITVINRGEGHYVYFKKPADWPEANIWHWSLNNGDITNHTTNPDWPGDAMEPAFEYGGSWFRFPIPADLIGTDDNGVRVIFNCGSDCDKTPERLFDVTGPAWLEDGEWRTEAPLGVVAENGTQIQILRGVVTLSGGENLSAGLLPLGSVVDIVSDDILTGQKFEFWQGAGTHLMLDPKSTSTKMLIDDALSYSISAIVNQVTDEHVVGRAFFNDTNCAGCHGADGSTPVLSSTTGEFVTLVDIGERYTEARLAEIIRDTMPLGSTEQCGEADGCAGSIAAMLYEQAFFPPAGLCSATDLDASARGYRLLTTDEYNNSIRDLLGLPLSTAVDVTDAVPGDVSVNGFFTNANMLFTSEYASGYIAASEMAAEMVGNIYSLVSCNQGDTSCFIDEFAKKAYRRPLEAIEFAALLELQIAQGDNALLSAILSSPAMLLRSEVGERISAIGEAPLYQLTDYEIATYLSYTYWATTPDDLLISAADRGELNTPSQISAMLESMLQDPRADVAFERFITGWLHLDERHPVPDSALSPSLKEAMRQETIAFVRNIVFDNGTYRELLTADYSFMNEELANHYGLSWPGGSGIQKVFYPASDENSERRGLFGHGSILTATSGGLATHPVRRGLFVRRSLMCQEFGSPPLGANLDPVIREDQTVRQRFELNHQIGPDDSEEVRLQKASCVFCHQHIDGIGFAFENYNHLGLWVTEETLGNGQVVPIDSSGDIGNLNTIETVLLANEPKQDFQGIDVLAELIADSTNGQACYARQWFRYTTGRHEDAGDACTLQAYAEDFKADPNASLFQLMIDFTQTSNFSLRK